MVQEVFETPVWFIHVTTESHFSAEASGLARDSVEEARSPKPRVGSNNKTPKKTTVAATTAVTTTTTAGVVVGPSSSSS